MSFFRAYCLSIFSIILITSCGSEEEMMETPLPALNISNASIVEGDSDKTISFEVALTGQMVGTVNFEYQTIDGSAIGGEDFIAVQNGTASISSGATSTTLNITVTGDTEVEGEEAFQVEITNPTNARILRGKATGTIQNDDIDIPQITVTIPDAGATSPESYDGMTLVWNDEFNTDKLNLEDWTHEMGDGCPDICGWGNNELEYYQDKNAAIIDNEYLVIEARQESIGGSNFTSSRIISKDKQEFSYGRIDIRAALPKGQGIWPALWMLGANIDDVGWPACGEIDIMEIIGNEPAKLHGTAHWDDAGSYSSFGLSTDLLEGDFSDEFHVFSLIWEENKLIWLLDDVEYSSLNTASGNLSEFRKPFFFIFNIAVGGNWPGSPDGSTIFPQHLIVDYIRVFQ